MNRSSVILIIKKTKIFNKLILCKIGSKQKKPLYLNLPILSNEKSHWKCKLDELKNKWLIKSKERRMRGKKEREREKNKLN